MPSVDEVAKYYEDPNRWKIVVYSPFYVLYFLRQRSKTLELLLKYAKPSKNVKLLDAGCGYGRYTAPLSKMFDVYAADISSAMLNRVRKFTKKTYRCDISKTKFQNNYFDVVFCTDVTNHLESLEKTIAEFHRILKPNGLLLTNITNRRSTIRILNILIKKLADLLEVNIGTPISKYYKLSELKDVVASKFRIVDVREHRIIGVPKITPFQYIVILKKI
jgi:ubiquinone/menaquinone biosynthesis C-methylase UbiE